MVGELHAEAVGEHLSRAPFLDILMIGKQPHREVGELGAVSGRRGEGRRVEVAAQVGAMWLRASWAVRTGSRSSYRLRRTSWLGRRST